MSDHLPSGWVRTVVGEIAERVTKGTTPTTLGFKYSGAGIRFVKVESLKHQRIRHELCAFISAEADAELKRSRLQAGDVLFSIAGTLGRVAVVTGADVPANTNQAIAIVRPTAAVESSFLAGALHHGATLGKAVRGGRGVGLQNLNLQQLSDVQVDLPPLGEQRRIVTKLEALQARSRRAREALDAVPPLLEKLRQSILAAAFRGDLTKDWRAKQKDIEPATELLKRIRTERRQKWESAELAKLKSKGKPPTDDKWKAKYKEPEAADTKRLPALPDEWCWATVEELSTKVVDGVHQKPNYLSEGVPFLTVRNLTAGPGISFERVSYITQHDHEEFVKRADPEQGDILISKDGTLGVTRLVSVDTVFSIFVSLALVKPVRRGMGEYLEKAFCSPIFQERFKATGSGLLHIHLIDLRSAVLPICCAAEQTILATRLGQVLNTLDAFVANHTSTVTQLMELERSVLAKAFRGELVPQDPNDEPAESMLARARSTNGAAPTNGTPPKRGRPRAAQRAESSND